MTIAQGATLPQTAVVKVGPAAHETVSMADFAKGRTVVLFAVPGAFTPTCDSAHMPSFVRTAQAFRDKGVDEIACVSVNDVHVMRYWGRLSGAFEAGITMLADPAGEFTKAAGMAFSAPGAGMFDRSKRYALVARDGVVTVLNLEQPGVCEVSTGEAMLEAV